MAWRYFKLEDFACKHCGANLVKQEFVSRLDDLRHRCGFPLVVNSGYRCPEYNDIVSTTGPDGPHTTGSAADLAVDRGRAYVVLKEALKMGFSGIGVNQKGGGRFIHVDDLLWHGRPTVWSY